MGGLTSKYLIDESVVTATDEERARAKATPLGRIAVVIVGSVAVIVGLYSSYTEVRRFQSEAGGTPLRTI